jgi:hypothetical protein
MLSPPNGGMALCAGMVPAASSRVGVTSQGVRYMDEDKFVRVTVQVRLPEGGAEREIATVVSESLADLLEEQGLEGRICRAIDRVLDAEYEAGGGAAAAGLRVGGQRVLVYASGRNVNEGEGPPEFCAVVTPEDIPTFPVAAVRKDLERHAARFFPEQGT